MIVAGSTSQSLAAEMAGATDHQLADVRYQTFPDGERIVRLDTEGVRPDHAVVVAATTSDAAHVEVLQLQDAAREVGAEHVTTVLPYVGYARQDEVFEPGEPLSARAVARALSTGTDRVVTVNPHEPGVCGFFDVPATAVDAGPRLGDALPSGLTDPLFLAPDESALDLSQTVQARYGTGATDHFVKTRVDPTTVEIEPQEATVTDRDVILVDDMVATGSTMCEAIDVLTARGVNDVYVACIHPLLVGNARLRLARAGVKSVVGTDTVERPESEVTVAPTIAAEL